MAGKLPKRFLDCGNDSVLSGRGLMSSSEQSQFPDVFQGVESVKDELYLCRSENQKLDPPQSTSESKSIHRIRRPTERKEMHTEKAGIISTTEPEKGVGH